MNPYYADERVTLWRADALALLPTLAEASVDALITDPPYSSGGMMRSDRTNDVHTKYVQSNSMSGAALADFSGDNRDQRGYGYWCSLWLGEALRAVKPGGVCILFCDWRQLPVTTDVLQAGGWVWRGVVPWVKPDPRPQMGRFAAACEYVVWGSRGPMGDGLDVGCLPGFFQDRAPRDRVHITQKPLGVLRSLVKIAPRNGVVLDPFAGSGTTGVAALIEGRRFIGGELADHHCSQAAQRLATAAMRPTDDQLDMLAEAGR